jgi:hypothetical protein
MTPVGNGRNGRLSSHLAGLRGATEALECVRCLAFDPPEAAVDAAFDTDS